MEHIALKKRSILDSLLVCPSCHGDLKDEQERYVCTTCRSHYPVTNGVPRFVDSLSRGERQVSRSFDLEHRRYLDSRYLHFTPQLIDRWVEEIDLPPDFFTGKLVLDAGCGSGRWTYAMASLGATVVAADLTEAGAEVTHQATAHMDNVAVLQGNIFQLPLRPGSFDLVVSWGVLHHTPDTKRAFDRVAPLVKPGGQLYVMVYEKHNNPLKVVFTGLIRAFLRRFPEEQRFQLCRLLIVRNWLLASVLQRFIICAFCAPTADPGELSTLQLGLYDAYSPIYNHLHTREEVAGWFHEHRFERLALTKWIRFTQKRGVQLAKEWRGSINLRGVRT